MGFPQVFPWVWGLKSNPHGIRGKQATWVACVVQVRAQLAAQLSALQAEMDVITVRVEEETEAAQSARAQLQRAQQDYQTLKSKYDKEIIALTDELEDTR